MMEALHTPELLDMEAVCTSKKSSQLKKTTITCKKFDKFTPEGVERLPDTLYT